MKRAPSLLIAGALLLGIACELGDGTGQERDSGKESADASVAKDASQPEDTGAHTRDAGTNGDRDVPPGRDGGGGQDEFPKRDGGGAQDAGRPADTGSCPAGTWPAADPSVKGSFTVVTEDNVGPAAGTLENGTQPHFIVIRPSTLGQCHPVITWGNGYGDNPPTYMVLLKQLASHGFVVIASLSHYVSKGDPPPMKVGVDWLIEQNEDPTSVMYRHLDTTHIGATGHSAGGFATAKLGSDPRITAIATICGATANRELHGPALLLCGGQDTMATCTGMQSAFDGITNQPVMLANQLSATHGSWIGSIKDPFMIAVTGWMRLHLMGDTTQRKMFYGADCSLCKNTGVWKVQQKMMEQ